MRQNEEHENRIRESRLLASIDREMKDACFLQDQIDHSSGAAKRHYQHELDKLNLRLQEFKQELELINSSHLVTTSFVNRNTFQGIRPRTLLTQSCQLNTGTYKSDTECFPMNPLRDCTSK